MTYWINVWQRTVSSRFGNVGDLSHDNSYTSEADAIEEIRCGYEGWGYVETLKRTDSGVERVLLDHLVDEETAA